MAQSFHVTPRYATLDYEELGTLTVRDGCAIDVRLLPRADEALLPLYLTGAAMAILLYQRGLLVLQASAIAIRDMAAVFMANSGGGKSALAARLIQQGHTLLADDITAIDMRSGGPVVIPAAPFLMLDPETEAVLGHAQTQPQSFHTVKRKNVRAVEHAFANAPIPLRVVYSIETRGDNNISYVPLQMGLAGVMRRCYPTCLLQPASIDHLRQCSRLVGAVPVCELSRRFQFEDLFEVTDMIGAHVLSGTLTRSSASRL